MKLKKPKKILFITPGATPAGGNIFLLNFLKWFKKNHEIPFITVYGHGGELEDDLAELSKTFEYNYRNPQNLFKKAVKKISSQFELRKYWLKHQIQKENIGLIYANAVTNHKILSAISNLQVPIISHCHELESVIRRTGLEGFRETNKKTDYFIAVSEAVRRNLIDNHQVQPEKISLIYGFIPIHDFSNEDLREKKRKVCHELGIPENSFIVGASGTMYWRKAPEIFVLIADAIRQKKPEAPIYFVWVGGANKDDFCFFEVNYDVKKLGLEKHVKFLENKINPLDYFAAFNIFAMTSREDPFPLVCLEAASLGKPIICFDDAGGIPEFVEGNCGALVPYLDIGNFADKILALYSNPQLVEKLGRCAAQKAHKNHDILTSAPKIVEIIERFWTSNNEASPKIKQGAGNLAREGV